MRILFLRELSHHDTDPDRRSSGISGGSSAPGGFSSQSHVLMCAREDVILFPHRCIRPNITCAQEKTDKLAGFRLQLIAAFALKKKKNHPTQLFK